LTTKLLTDEALVDAKTADDKAAGLATAANMPTTKLLMPWQIGAPRS
jgi:hypothetical protein